MPSEISELNSAFYFFFPSILIKIKTIKIKIKNLNHNFKMN